MKLLRGRDAHQQHFFFLLSRISNGQEQVELPLLPPSTLLVRHCPTFSAQAVSEEVRMQQALGTGTQLGSKAN